jgi:hypothetical protein
VLLDRKATLVLRDQLDPQVLLDLWDPLDRKATLVHKEIPALKVLVIRAHPGPLVHKVIQDQQVPQAQRAQAVIH